jgi:hypothetical protein
MSKPNEQLCFEFHTEALRDNLLNSALQVWSLWNRGYLQPMSHEAAEETNKRFGELTESLIQYQRIGVTA